KHSCAQAQQTPEYRSTNRASISRRIRKCESDDSTEHRAYKRTARCGTESAFVSRGKPSQQKPRGTSSNPLETLIGSVPKAKCQPIHSSPYLLLTARSR